MMIVVRALPARMVAMAAQFLPSVMPSRKMEAQECCTRDDT